MKRSQNNYGGALCLLKSKYVLSTTGEGGRALTLKAGPLKINKNFPFYNKESHK